MIQIQVMPAGVDPKDYWIIYPQGTSWYYLMQELLRSLGDLEKQAKDMPAFISAIETGEPVYFFKKSRVTVEQLMKITGMTRAVIEQSKYLHLVETEKEGIPKPTVDYWGRA